MASNNTDLENVILQVVFDELGDNMEINQSDPVAEALALRTRKRAVLLGTARISNYVEETVPRYSDPLFRAHFCMTRTSFQSLLELIGPFTVVRSLSLERRTLACLWYLSNQETFRSVADRFGMSKGSLHYYLGNFCNTLSSANILPKLISWPDKRQYGDIADGFAQRQGFPGVIGAIDGTYIPITGPTEFRDSYICRKGFPAFHLQGVCDSSLKFLDVYSAYPGSVHDARVFRNSTLHDYLQMDCPQAFHLLGDSAYSLSSFLLVPFRDNGHLTSEQKKFNFALSSTRVDIERCFGLLKGKFRKLKFLDVTKVTMIPNIIISCCVLHNFILIQESYVEKDILHNDDDDARAGNPNLEETCTTGTVKRNDIMNLLA
ncbi:putative nuclease HARBI1 [Ruditapes philippinarum]|uniref:putative nuclease HARBI1 n=1 Tax=Ruditapes philippinarum TaxID=129788 RepID=UPI00295B1F9B|nr:putative nuclease HARBI1 [Ruditapes philippinarum]